MTIEDTTTPTKDEIADAVDAEVGVDKPEDDEYVEPKEWYVYPVAFCFHLSVVNVAFLRLFPTCPTHIVCSFVCVLARLYLVGAPQEEVFRVLRRGRSGPRRQVEADPDLQHQAPTHAGLPL